MTAVSVAVQSCYTLPCCMLQSPVLSYHHMSLSKFAAKVTKTHLVKPQMDKVLGKASVDPSNSSLIKQRALGALLAKEKPWRDDIELGDLADSLSLPLGDRKAGNALSGSGPLDGPSSIDSPVPNQWI
ncbi:hypothetical protein EDC04DRAFT_2603896 [Pisolithus marmoratus]|nr:hypothetical protein EDC04DRAFT_2603896 [Pisolithus marmoratus]